MFMNKTPFHDLARAGHDFRPANRRGRQLGVLAEFLRAYSYGLPDTSQQMTLNSDKTVWTSHGSVRIVRTHMRPLKLKISDLAAVTEYTRFQVDGLLKQVFANSLGKKAGSQRSFSPQDLLVAAIACEIEQKYGVGRKTLALASEALRRTLTAAREANWHARLLVTFSPPTATYLHPDAPVEEGLVVRLDVVFARIDEYLGVSRSNSESMQGTLPLNPGIVSSRRRSGVRRQ